MPRFEHDGVQLHYLIRGEGAPVVLQHGLGGEAGRTAELLSTEARLRLIALDSRGHGRSELGDPSRLSFATMADDLAALLDLLSINHAIVGGYSMGAGVTLAYALRHPGRVSGLVLIRPAWLFEPLPPNLAHLPAMADLIRRHGLEEAAVRFARTDGYRALADGRPATAASLYEQFARARATETVALLDAMPRDVPVADPRSLATLTMPTLIVGCEDDPIHPLGMAEQLNDLLPCSQLVEVPSKNRDPQRYAERMQEIVTAFAADQLDRPRQ